MIEQLLKALGADATVLEIKPGQTVEEAIAEHEANCPECQERKAQERPTDAQQKEGEASRQRALRAVRTAQADLLQRYDMLKALEKSIDTPAAERTPKHTLDEILLMLSLKGL